MIPGGRFVTGPLPTPPPPVLQVEGLTVRDAAGSSLVEAMDIHVGAGERVGIIGESGSGKSITALSLMGLLPEGLTLAPIGGHA